MKRCLLSLTALTLLLGACSSFQPSRYHAKSPPPPPIQAGNKITLWGELPSYEQKGQSFHSWAVRRLFEANLAGRVVVDVLIEADGRVQDAAIFESSGNSDLDRMALRLYKNSRYSLRLGPGDPAPYVVRQEFIAQPPLRSSLDHIDATNYRTMGPDVRATPGPYAPSSSVTEKK